MTPSTGMQYSREVSFEFARRLSAAGQRLPSSFSTIITVTVLGALPIEALESGGSHTSEQAERAAAHG